MSDDQNGEGAEFERKVRKLARRRGVADRYFRTNASFSQWHFLIEE
jgi:hypothetical protein